LSEFASGEILGFQLAVRIFIQVFQAKKNLIYFNFNFRLKKFSAGYRDFSRFFSWLFGIFSKFSAGLIRVEVWVPAYVKLLKK